jgi:hypothetical protein
LIREGIIAPIPARQLQPPYPNGFDCNATCDYHDGVTGHSTEKCFTLRAKIQELIDSGQIQLNSTNPDINATIPDSANIPTRRQNCEE